MKRIIPFCSDLNMCNVYFGEDNKNLCPFNYKKKIEHIFVMEIEVFEFLISMFRMVDFSSCGIAIIFMHLFILIFIGI